LSFLQNLIERDYKLEGDTRYLKALEHDSLVLDTYRDLFFWNSKEINGDAYIWLTKVKGKNPLEARQIIREAEIVENKVYVSIDTPRGEELTVYPKLVEVFWESGKTHRDYWYKRGITDKTIDTYQLGYTSGWYVIPFFVDRTLNNFQMRRDLPTKRIKSWYSGVGPLLWNGDMLKHCSSVILTESPTDALLLRQFGYPAVSHNAGATYWNDSWNKLFNQQKIVYVVFDNDEPGEKGAQLVANSLGEYKCRLFTFKGYPDKYDLGDWLLDNKGNENNFGRLLLSEAKYSFER